ncbi:MAG: acetyl-CoA carboxylase biotin carboxyl carrier protein [Bacteroidota bacterium]|nr:acetyl-CoA carboxylase biotin carboxyl carrier protein [Bacteroidota bacterium]
MKIDEIHSLIKFVAKSGVSEIELEMTDFSIKIKNTSHSQESILVQIPAQETAANILPALQMPVVSEPLQKHSADIKNSDVVDESKYITVKSPMIGTFYRTSGPGKPAFVSIGDEIKVGQTLCIIEAMKLFNEIESEVSGKVIKILFDDSSPVEYDSPLFLVDPS